MLFARFLPGRMSDQGASMGQMDLSKLWVALGGQVADSANTRGSPLVLNL
jgi:hypothetical protein